MADREKVIKGLTECIYLYEYPDDWDSAGCVVCPYRPNGKGICDTTIPIQLLKDALELLKKQEQKHGRWEPLTGMAPPEYHGHKICSICECFAPYDPIHVGRETLSPYCPGCGAKMEVGIGDDSK